MRTEMIEAARLTRAGRLGEATALIRRSLGMRATTAGGRARVVETPFIDIGSSSAQSEPEASPVGKADEKTPAQPEAERRTGFRAPLAPEAQLDLSALGGLQMPAGFSKLRGRGPLGRTFPPEVVAPATGQWLERAYRGETGGRAYKLYVPGRDDGEPRPLVVMLHGCTQGADDFAAGTRMNFVGEEEGVLVVYPEQAMVANSSRCWNWFQSADQQRARGEPSIIAGITREVMAGHNVDPTRVSIAGLSAGGAMAAIVAAVYPDLFGVVGVHSGLAPGNAHDLPSALQAMQGRGLGKGSAAPGRLVPLILFQGDRDSTVHPNNAEEFIRQWVGGVEAPGVSLRQGQVPGGKAYSCATYRDSEGQTRVERWTIHGAGHAWSGGSPNGSFTDPRGPGASSELVRFFREHPRGSWIK